jgi:hypothetical protein
MKRQLCFSKLVCFFPWLAVFWFHNFELTQNRKKNQEMVLPEVVTFISNAFSNCSTDI